MATYTCSIGGSSRRVMVQGFRIQETLNGVDTLQCQVVSLDGSYVPSVGDDIQITEDASTIFGGLVETVSVRGVNKAGNTSGLSMAVTAKSYAIFPQRRIITITLAAGTLKAQLTQLNTAAFSSSFSTTIHASQADGPSMPEIAFTDTRCDAILDVMMKTATSIAGAGYAWNIDATNALRATSTGEVSAPFSVTDTNGNAIKDIEVETTRNDLYANRLLIEIASGPATSTETFVAADGVTSGGLITFTAKYPASQSIFDTYPNVLYIDGVAQSTIGFGASQLGPDDWYWDSSVSPAELVYPIAGGRPFPTGAEEVEITYAIRYPITTTVEDTAGITAYGEWDRKIRPPTALSDVALQDYAAGVLASLSPVKTEVRYPTLQTGILPGMAQTVNSTKRGFNDTVLVQEVETSWLTDEVAQRMVSGVASDAFQGTFRGTVDQWMSTGGETAAVVAAGVSGSSVAPPIRGIQFNRDGSPGASDELLHDYDGGGETFGVEDLAANFASMPADESKLSFAFGNRSAGLDKALTGWQLDGDGTFYIELDGGGDLVMSVFGGGSLQLSGVNASLIGGESSTAGSHLRLGKLIAQDTVFPNVQRKTTSFTLDAAYGGGGLPENVVVLDAASSQVVTLPVVTADSMSLGSSDSWSRQATFINTGSASWALTPASGSIEGLSTRPIVPGERVVVQAFAGTGAGWFVVSSYVKPFATTLTDAEIKALPTTPITVLAAAPSGYRWVPSRFVLEMKATAGAYAAVDASAYLNMQFGTSGPLASGYLANDASTTPALADMDALFKSADNSTVELEPYMAQVSPESDEWGVMPEVVATGDLDGSAIRLVVNNGSSGNFTGGNSANTLTVTVYAALQRIV